METTYFNYRWKSNAEQPYIKNAKRPLFTPKHSKKFCSMEDMVSLKWLLVPERIGFTVLKMTFKSLLNERMPSNFQISIKEKKRELRAATETTKLTLTSEFYQICNNTI